MKNSEYLLAKIACLALAVSSTTGLAAKEAPVLLKPKESWVLDMGEHKCRIARGLSSDKGDAVFYLEQYSPSDAAFFAVAGAAVEDLRPGSNTAFAFGPGGDSDSRRLTSMTFGPLGNLVGTTSTIASAQDKNLQVHSDPMDHWKSNPRGLPGLDEAGAQAIDTLTLAQKGRADVVVKLGSLKPALAAMNTCMEDLVRHWGFDPAEQRTVVSPPQVTNLSTVARLVMQDYPARAQNSGAQANFQLRLTIAADGKVENCALVNQTAAEKFDMEHGPCAIFLRTAKAKPALDAEGKPIRSFYVNTIAYRMQ